MLSCVCLATEVRHLVMLHGEEAVMNFLQPPSMRAPMALWTPPKKGGDGVVGVAYLFKLVMHIYLFTCLFLYVSLFSCASIMYISLHVSCLI